MPIQLRIAAVVTAAVIAAAANHRYLADQLETHAYVSISRELKAGQRVGASDVRLVQLSGDLAALDRVLVPWTDRGGVIGQVARKEYEAGELIVYRDIEQGYRRAYRPGPDEYPMTITHPIADEIKTAFQIGGPVGFLIVDERGGGGQPQTYECGPFTLRAIGPVTKPLEPRLMQKVPGQTFTLSVPKGSTSVQPELAARLLKAISGRTTTRIVGLYYPRETPPAVAAR